MYSNFVGSTVLYCIVLYLIVFVCIIRAVPKVQGERPMGVAEARVRKRHSICSGRTKELGKFEKVFASTLKTIEQISDSHTPIQIQILQTRCAT